MDTKSEIKRFLSLRVKSVVELQSLCKELNLVSEGDQGDLIDRLMGYQKEVERPALLPQAIPLRTIDDNGNQMPEAIETIKRWRKLIFDTKGNQKEFQLVNGQGQPYKARLHFVRCSIETLKGILERKWYFAHPSQEHILNALIEKPEDFEVSIIQKPSGKGNSWIMVHCLPKAA